jgi:glycosyltransferase involved in cell wall biosynthesis
MSAGRSTIVAREGGAAELFTPDEDALGVTPRDPDALARAIDRLVASPDERARLGAAARRTALARFARDRFEDALAALYERTRRGPGHEARVP